MNENCTLSVTVLMQAAAHVWKIIVTNTLTVLKLLLPVLFRVLLESLACPEAPERKLTAARWYTSWAIAFYRT